MLAVAGEVPLGPGWAYEFKWDGVRAIAEVRDGILRLFARTRAEITKAYPELAGLPERPGHQQHQAVGPKQRRVQGQSRRRPRLPRPARTVQQHLPVRAQQEVPLPRVRGEPLGAKDARRVQGKGEQTRCVH